ncbi:two-component sensor histidine kinase [Brevirhabdus pacifica]|uniref:histidine kinase n=2 Tax=Brevirhabdus pacifica TaxID=1267768 RepID=A0A1U7DLV8_9RHOB|nr:HAMP domain-containing sensor histidine kinase [Brevirhabdus pacifica]APX90962.1 two-component sensor histidine kinase [Brevirhabdus pacifica]
MRMAIGLVLLFSVISLLSLGGTYLVLRNTFDQALRDDLRQEVAGFRAAPSAAALAALVEAQARVTDPDRRIVSYLAPDGRAYGNGAIERSEEGFRIVVFDRPNTPVRESYLALTAGLHRGQLTVANSRSQIDDLGEMFATVLLLSLLPTVIFALGGGLLIARRTARRLTAVEATLDRLASGDLAARVPELPGRADDLTAIAARVDRMAEAQQQSVSALRQVSADIAHDLKTPIQRVSVLLDRLQGNAGLDPEARELARRAGAETENIVATFQSLLQIAQIEGGSPRSRFEVLDLAALAATLAEVYEPAAEEGGRRLVLEAEAPVRVNGERRLLGQVLANLIENALRHTPPGSLIELSVRESGENGGQAVLELRDNGPGIPAEERGNVLRRLYRLEQSRSTPGSGLGLSLVSVIADLHGATLELGDNAPGLVVTLRFPPVSPRPLPRGKRTGKSVS